MSKFVILLGGHLEVTPRLKSQIEGARFIAADAGMRHAERLRVKPELWVGDFDSSSVDLIDLFADVPRQIFPPEKDLTDGEIAVEAALERGATEIIVAGAFGGDRADHTFQILAMAVARREEFSSVILTSGNEEAIPLTPGTQFESDLPDRTLFSILSFTDVTGLTLTGAKWLLKERRIPFGSSLTLSNEVDESGSLTVELATGDCLLYAKLD